MITRRPTEKEKAGLWSFNVRNITAVSAAMPHWHEPVGRRPGRAPEWRPPVRTCPNSIIIIIIIIIIITIKVQVPAEREG